MSKDIISEKTSKSSTGVSWKKVIVIITIIVSFSSVFITLHNENINKSANIQASKSHSIKLYDDSKTPTFFEISGSLELINRGNASAQIVDVRWDSTTTTDQEKTYGWLAISDEMNPLAEDDFEYFSKIKDSPISGIKNRKIEPGKVLELKFVIYQYLVEDDSDSDQNIRIEFTFSNGQQVAVISEFSNIEREDGLGAGENFTHGKEIVSSSGVLNSNECQTGSCTPPPNTPLPQPFPTPTIISTLETVCQYLFETHELHNSKTQQSGGVSRFTLGGGEVLEYYGLMGISNICIPLEAGAPFINADWNEKFKTATRGRMVSLGFENLYSGSGWSQIFLIYSTYDFAAGTEYDRFITREEWQAFNNGSLEGVEILPDGKGFIRYTVGLGYSNYPIYKVTIFPSEEDYTAVVINLGSFDGDVADEVDRLQQGQLPDSALILMPIYDRMVTSIEMEKE